MNISFGKSKLSAPKPQTASKKRTAFGGGSDSEGEGEFKAPAASTSKPKKAAPAVRPQAQLSRAQKQQLAAAEAADASVFAYDEVFDSMKSAQQQVRDASKKNAEDRKPQYVEALLKSAEQRKLDRVRAEDVMTQREREKEGSEFTDKESFVTPAYLAQQQELREAEEADKANGANVKGGMAKFYEQYLSSSADATSAASEAARQHKSATGAPIQPPPQQYDDEPVSDIHLAREAAGRLNKVVQVNEDGQVVDRTELLQGGLNVGLPKKPQGPSAKPELGGFAIPIAERAAKERAEREAAAALEEEPHHSGLSQRERDRLRKERQSRQIQEQLVELQKRKAVEDEEELNRQVKRVARRNDETKIEKMKREAAERRAAKALAEGQSQEQAS